MDKAIRKLKLQSNKKTKINKEIRGKEVEKKRKRIEIKQKKDSSRKMSKHFNKTENKKLTNNKKIITAQHKTQINKISTHHLEIKSSKTCRTFKQLFWVQNTQVLINNILHSNKYNL